MDQHDAANRHAHALATVLQDAGIAVLSVTEPNPDWAHYANPTIHVTERLYVEVCWNGSFIVIEKQGSGAGFWYCSKDSQNIVAKLRGRLMAAGLPWRPNPRGRP